MEFQDCIHFLDACVDRIGSWQIQRLKSMFNGHAHVPGFRVVVVLAEERNGHQFFAYESDDLPLACSHVARTVDEVIYKGKELTRDRMKRIKRMPITWRRNWEHDSLVGAVEEIDGE